MMVIRSQLTKAAGFKQSPSISKHRTLNWYVLADIFLSNINRQIISLNVQQIGKVLLLLSLTMLSLRQISIQNPMIKLTQSAVAAVATGVTRTPVLLSLPMKLSQKHAKLSATDKENIQNLYGRLDKDKMWKLSTGKIVEEQMMKLAMIQEYEQ